LFDLGYAAIDGHVFIDGDGKIYFYYSKDCCENRLPDGTRASQLYCVRMNEDLTSVYGEHVLVSTPTEPWEKLSRDPLWNEGPCMLKYGGRYFLSYSINFFSSDHYGIAVSVADCPMGPFVKMEDNPRLSKAQGIRGPGHNAYFTGFDGKLYSVLHIRDVMPDGKVDRMACVTEVKLDENGVHFND